MSINKTDSVQPVAVYTLRDAVSNVATSRGPHFPATPALMCALHSSLPLLLSGCCRVAAEEHLFLLVETKEAGHAFL